MIKNKVNRGARRFCLLVLSLTTLVFTPAAGAAQDEGWTLSPSARVEAGVVSAETATRDEQIVVNGDALTFRGQLAFDLEDDDTRFRLEADRIEVVRLGEGRSDSNRDRITVQVDQELSPGAGYPKRGSAPDRPDHCSGRSGAEPRLGYPAPGPVLR